MRQSIISKKPKSINVRLNTILAINSKRRLTAISAGPVMKPRKLDNSSDGPTKQKIKP